MPTILTDIAMGAVPHIVLKKINLIFGPRNLRNPKENQVPGSRTKAKFALESYVFVAPCAYTTLLMLQGCLPQ